MNIESKKDNKGTKLETEVLRANSGNKETQHTPMIPDHHKGKAEKLKEEVIFNISFLCSLVGLSDFRLILPLKIKIFSVVNENLIGSTPF